MQLCHNCDVTQWDVPIKPHEKYNQLIWNHLRFSLANCECGKFIFPNQILQLQTPQLRRNQTIQAHD